MQPTAASGIGADAQEKPEAGNGAVKLVEEAAYRTLINLGTGYVDNQCRTLRLSPGMQVNAEIHLGTRSNHEYLLSPVQEFA